ESRRDRAAGRPGGVDDVEPVPDAARQRVEDQRRRIGEVHEPELYLCRIMKSRMTGAPASLHTLLAIRWLGLGRAPVPDRGERQPDRADANRIAGDKLLYRVEAPSGYERAVLAVEILDRRLDRKSTRVNSS